MTESNNIMSLCVVGSCLSVVGHQSSLFQFPEDPLERLEWAKILGIDATTISECSVVCNAHFREEDTFLKRRGSLFCTHLKPGSKPVPTNFSETGSSDETKRRKSNRKSSRNVENKTRKAGNRDAARSVEMNSAGSSSSTVFHDFLIDSNQDKYFRLTNSNVTGHRVSFRQEQLDNCVGYMQKHNAEYREVYPGVAAGTFADINNTKVGYLKIQPRSILPLEISMQNYIYWILTGEVIVRSTAYSTQDGDNILAGKTLKQGSCITVPLNTPYTLENRTDTNVVIGYVIVATHQISDKVSTPGNIVQQ